MSPLLGQLLYRHSRNNLYGRNGEEVAFILEKQTNKFATFLQQVPHVVLFHSNKQLIFRDNSQWGVSV